MALVNRYFRRSKLSEATFRRLVRCFSLDLTATQTAGMIGLSVRSVNTIFLRMRRKIAAECERQSPLEGVLEADESYFGPQRVRGKCGRGAGGKTIVFGLFTRRHKDDTAIVPNASKAALQAVIRGRASLGSVLHTDGWAGYNGLVNLGSTSTSGSSIGTTSSPVKATTSTALRASGAWQKDAWQSSAVYPDTPSTFTSKRRSSASTTETKTSIKSCYNFSERPTLSPLLPKPHADSLRE